MVVAFPVMEDRGLESAVHDHFGSARYFVLADTVDNTATTHINPDQNHRHGQCQPLLALGVRGAEAVVVGGIGRGALSKLAAGGIKAFRAVEGTVLENLDLIRGGHLPEFEPNQTCTGHTPGGGCMH
jgi:predicted Fe-Mo cluster-binding NifX family protein